MIRYVCDLCKRELDPKDALRFAVTIEIAAAFDPVGSDEDEDRDHLEEIEDLLERAAQSGEDQLGYEPLKVLHFDLCPECREKFVKNPLGREPAKVLDFSEN